MSALTPAASLDAPGASPPHTESAARRAEGSDWPGGSRQVWPGWCRAQSLYPGGAARNHWHPMGVAGAWSVEPSLSWGQDSQGGIHRPEGCNTVQGFSGVCFPPALEGSGGPLRRPHRSSSGPAPLNPGQGSKALTAVAAFLKGAFQLLEKVVDVVIEGATHVVKKVATAASKGTQQVMAVCTDMATNAFREARRTVSEATTAAATLCNWVTGWFNRRLGWGW
jgi:hypothetical protein